MGADGHQRMSGHGADLVPVHQRARLLAVQPDAVHAREFVQRRAQVLLADLQRQPAMQAVVGLQLLASRRTIDRNRAIRRHQRQPITRIDDILDHVPPQIGGAVDQPRRDIDGDRRAVLFQHRQRLGHVVAIGVVGGDGRELAALAAGLDALDRLVERDEGVTVGLHVGDDGVEEAGGDVEMPIDALRLLRRRGDPVQHQDGADAADKRLRQRCQAGVAGDVERQFPDRLAPVDHSFTFCA